ncbi:MAG: DUF7284 family protein [Halodesulfurarchaeum sp.]
MTDRGLSTPIDVVVGLLLVGLAAGVVVNAVPVDEPAPADAGRPSLLGASMTVEFSTTGETWTVTGTAGGLLADAARAHSEGDPRAPAFEEAVVEEVSETVLSRGPMQVVGYCRADRTVEPIVVGNDPPSDARVRATVYDLPPVNESSESCEPAVSLRRWSS